MRGERLHSDHPEALANGTAENDMYLIAMSVCCDLEGSVHYNARVVCYKTGKYHQKPE